MLLPTWFSSIWIIYIIVYITFFWKYCVFTSLAQTVLFDLSLCCHWSFNASDSEGARELYTLRVGEVTVCDSALLFLTVPPTPLCCLPSTVFTAPKAAHPALLKNSLFKHTCGWPWTLNTLGGNLNIEGNLRRTEAALWGPRLHSLCVVLMSTFVPTVAFQIHANRRPVLCVAHHRWLPLWTLQQHVVAKHCDALLPQS